MKGEVSVEMAQVMVIDRIMDRRGELSDGSRLSGDVIDYKGECAGDWADKAAEYIRKVEGKMKKERPELMAEEWKLIGALGEYFATGDMNDIDGLESRMGWCGLWEVRKSANEATRTLGIDEIKWPEVEDEYCWWDGEQCEFVWDPGPGDKFLRDCKEVCDNENGYGGEYDGKAYCGRHLAWMVSEATDCVDCGKEVSEPEFNDSAVETGDPDSPHCRKCLLKRFPEAIVE